MEPENARRIAYASHGEQRDRTGDLLVAHLDRVAASVPREAQTVAYLHDLLEWTATSHDDLDALDLSDAEAAAVRLLTREPSESFEVHALSIAYARGPEGRLARTVKLADIDDHLRHDPVGSATRPYGWAKRHIVNRQERTDRGLRITSAA
jgi:hypothetical protein